MPRKILMVVYFLLLIGLACNVPGVDQPTQPIKTTALTGYIPSQTSTMTSKLPSATSPSSSRLTLTPTLATGEEDLGSLCGSGKSTVVLLVDSDYVEEIRPELNRFAEDLCGDGYDVILKLAEMSSPPDVRAYLQGLYHDLEGRLSGAILIGKIPPAYQWYRVTYANPDIPTREDEVISYQYYADLDGEFTASLDYNSPGGHTYSYDIHRGEMDWEIWVGVLPLYHGDRKETISALKDYFAKNHAYRAGEYDIPTGYLEIDEFHKAASD